MKQFFYSIFLAGFALMAASCQKVDEKTIDLASGDLTVTASIVDFNGTRMSYKVEGVALKAFWEEGDRIFGFDDTGKDFTYTVTGFEENGSAIFTGDYSGKNGNKLYAIYYPGKSAMDLDLDGKSLSVDLSSQNGTLNTSIPAIMCATATIENSTVNFQFTNQIAIVGINEMTLKKGNNPVAKEKITDITLHNVATKGAIKLDEEFKLFPDEQISDIKAEVDFTTGDDGKIVSSTLAPYFAVIPMESSDDEDIKLVLTASNAGNEYNVETIQGSLIVAGKYYFIGDNLSGNVAKIGETSYPSLTSAISYASGETTITMIGDDVEDCEIGSDKKITLDLNGHTITGCITVKSGGKLTVEDETETGKITNTNANCVKVEAGGSLTLNGGTVIGNGSNNVTSDVPVLVEGNSTNVVQTTATFNGGKIVQKGNSNKGALYVTNSTVNFPKGSTTYVLAEGTERAVYAASGVNLTIYGGKFEAKTGKSIFLNNGGGENNPILIKGGEFIGGAECVLLYNQRTHVNITGGRFKWKTDNYFCLLSGKDKDNVATKEQITVSGGYYVNNLSEDMSFSLSQNYCIKSMTPPIDGIYSCVVDLNDEQNAVELEKYSDKTKQNYTTIDDAFKDIKNTPAKYTIKLLRNVIAGDSLFVENGNYRLTLDLNGKILTGHIVNPSSYLTITDSSNSSGEVNDGTGRIIAGGLPNEDGTFAVRVRSNKTGTAPFILEGGTLEADNNTLHIESLTSSNAVAQIKNGTIRATGQDGDVLRLKRCTITFCLNNSVGKVAVMGPRPFWSSTNTQITINNGEYTTTKGGSSMFYFGVDGENYSLTINNGKFNSMTAPQFFTYYENKNHELVNPTVNIFGGDFSWRLAFAKSQHTNLKIFDGTFVSDVSDNCAENHACDGPDSNGKYNVVRGIIKVGDKYCTSVDDAKSKIDGALSGVTVKLLKDVSFGSLTINKEVSIDLNGHTLTQNGTNRVSTSEEGYLIIKNGSLTNNSSGSNVLAMAEGGTIELQNVKITTATESTSSIAVNINPKTNKTSTFKMYGGSISSPSASSVVVQNNSNGIGIPIVEIRNVDITGNGTNGAFRIASTSEDENAKVEINGYNTKISSTNVALNVTGSIPCSITGGTITSSGSSSTISAAGPGSLTISGGAVKNTGSGNAIEFSNGNMEITGGTIESAQRYPIYANSSVANASVTIKGGTIKTLEGNTNYAVYVNAMPEGSRFIINSGDFRSYNRVICSGGNNMIPIQVSTASGIEEPYFYSYKSDGSSSDYVRLFFKENGGSAPQVRCGYFGCASPAEGWKINVSDFGEKSQKTLDPGKSHNGLTYTKHVE